MFHYLGASRHKFHFHRMVEPDAALYVTTYRLHHRLLRPWVSCALDSECLAPPGAQVSYIFCDVNWLPVLYSTATHNSSCSCWDCWGDFLQKSPSLRCFKSDRGENWHDCSSSKYTLNHIFCMTSYFQYGDYDVIFTPKSAGICSSIRRLSASNSVDGS